MKNIIMNLVGVFTKNVDKFNTQIKKEKSGWIWLSKIVTMILVLAISPISALSVDNKVESNFASTLRLNVQKVKAVEYEAPKAPEIKVGESEYDRKVREENEAKAKAEAEAASSRTVVSRESTTRSTAKVESDPDLATKRALVKSAAAKYGIDWKILEAVWQVESGKSWDTAVSSSAGAQGPMQFMPGTWRAYGQDGDGDGQANAYDAHDALYGAANYLAASGAASNVDQALLSYNHAGWYVTKVKNVANSITE